MEELSVEWMETQKAKASPPTWPPISHVLQFVLTILHKQKSMKSEGGLRMEASHICTSNTMCCFYVGKYAYRQRHEARCTWISLVHNGHHGTTSVFYTGQLDILRRISRQEANMAAEKSHSSWEFLLTCCTPVVH